MRQSSVLSAFLVLQMSMLMLVAGCGTTSDVELVVVEGRITLDGQPVQDAEVLFRPGHGRPSVGRTNADGQYVLTYTRDEVGALPGEHAVSISTFIEADDGAVDPIKQKGRKESIPRKYNQKTTLKASIPNGKSAVVNFPLVSR